MHRKEGLKTPPELMITPTVTWADVALAPDSLTALQRVADSARGLSAEVDDAREDSRPAGTLLVFLGEDRRNRRLAAEALANAMKVPIFRVDLAAVDDKWLAQTEANLDRVFAAADRAGVVLLLDEADALFAGRTEVKDAHDRFSTTEVSYLLQKIEEHHGLCILAANRKSHVDAMFTRRALLQIPFPRP
ncbi:MAG: AAA family ATPase [Actinomycetes bacterium]